MCFCPGWINGASSILSILGMQGWPLGFCVLFGSIRCSMALRKRHAPLFLLYCTPHFIAWSRPFFMGCGHVCTWAIHCICVLATGHVFTQKFFLSSSHLFFSFSPLVRLAWWMYIWAMPFFFLLLLPLLLSVLAYRWKRKAIHFIACIMWTSFGFFFYPFQCGGHHFFFHYFFPLLYQFPRRGWQKGCPKLQ